MIYFLVLPAREKSSDDEFKAELSGYADQVAMQNISISELERQIEQLNKEKEELKVQLDEANSKEVDTSKYDGVLSAAAKYFATDMIEMVLFYLCARTMPY
jgi:predicted RNase H-like nuclease (RuvC/YqgF family)